MAIHLHATEPPSGRPRTRQQLYDACWRGEEPAESLDTEDRDLLVHELFTQNWTVIQIAYHCRMSTYTTGRIWERLGLAPHHQREAAA